MSDLDSKLAKPEQRGGRPRAKLEHLQLRWGHRYEAKADPVTKQILIIRIVPWARDGASGVAETWKRVDGQWFERVEP